MNNSWEHIKDDLRNHEVPLSDRAWDNMAGLMGPEKKRRPWFSYFAVLLLFLVSGVGLYLFLSSDSRRLENAPETRISKQGPSEGQRKNEGGVSKAVLLDKNDKRTSEVSEEEEVLEETVSVVSKPKADVIAGPLPMTLGFLDSQKNDSKSQVDSEGFNNSLRLKLKELRFKSDNEDGQLTLTKEIVNNQKTRRRPLFKDAELKLFVSSTYNMPNMTYESTGSTVNKGYSSSVKDGVKAGLGYDAGVEFSVAILGHLRLNVGVGIREIVTRNNYSYEVNDIPVIDSASGDILAYIDRDSPLLVSDQSKNTYTYFNLPLSMRYDFPLNYRWTITGEAIHNFSFLMKASEHVVSKSDLKIEEGSTQNFSKTVNSYQFRLGLRYALNSNLDLALEPSYRSYYQDFYTQGPVSWKPRDFSISLSAIIKLK